MSQGEQVVAVLGQEATNLNHSQCSTLPPPVQCSAHPVCPALPMQRQIHCVSMVNATSTGVPPARLIVTTTSRKSTRRSSRLTSPSDKVPRVQTRSLCSLTPASNLPVPSISHRQQQFANVSPTLSFLSKSALGVSQRHGFSEKKVQ